MGGGGETAYQLLGKVFVTRERNGGRGEGAGERSGGKHVCVQMLLSVNACVEVRGQCQYLLLIPILFLSF